MSNLLAQGNLFSAYYDYYQSNLDQIRNKVMARGGDIETGKVDESVSVLVEHGPRSVEQWKSTLLRPHSPMPSKCCIFRVPEVLRRQNKKAYEPEVGSIGPFHRGGKQFQLVENVKKWYLTCLLSRLNISLESLIENIIQQLEKPTRDCYADTFDHLDQNKFVEMLILDGCFLIELFRKALSKNQQDEDDPIFNVPCMLENLYHDLLLLENQLPWFVLEFFYNLIENSTNQIKPPLSQVVIGFFKNSVADARIFSDHESNSPNILHILDLIRTALVEKHQDQIPQRANGPMPQRIPSVATLSERGIKFKWGTPGCILNITFKDGVFTIPPLAINERTGPLFRNLMAYEQCYHSCPHKITSYAVLMDNLIDRSKDVDLLCARGIVVNWLSAEDASKLFNRLYNDIKVIEYCYEGLCQDVDKYCNTARNKWRGVLMRSYFDTPWRAISVVNFYFIGVLTLLQTMYTIKTYYNPPL